MRGVLLVACMGVMASGCGRIGFAPVDDGGAAVGDGSAATGDGGGASSKFSDFVQVAATSNFVSATQQMFFVLEQNAGDFNVVVVGWGDSTVSVTSVTDTSGNTYALAAGPTLNPNINQSIYYAPNIAGAAAGTNEVIVQLSAATNADVRALEYSGIDPVSPFDSNNAGTGTAPTARTGFATITSAPELIVAAIDVGSGVAFPGAGYVERLLQHGTGSEVEDSFVTQTGQYDASAMLVNTTGFTINMATFKAVGSPPPFGYVQGYSNANDTTGVTSVTTIYNLAQLPGDLDVIVVAWEDATATINSVSDSMGNTYQLAVGPTRGSGESQSMYYASNIQGAGAGENLVVVTFNGAGATNPEARAYEYSGVSQLDVSLGAGGAGITADTQTVQTHFAPALIVAGAATPGACTNPGTDYVFRRSTDNYSIDESRIVTTTGQYRATAPCTGGDWAIQMAVFH